jgi:methyltransferase (TIGR00027 family)
MALSAPPGIFVNETRGGFVRSHRRSRTADAAAATRAAHRLYDRPIVFDDPLARDLTSPGWRRVCDNRWLYSLVVRTLLGSLRPVAGQVLSRARYAEDCLEDAVAQGIEQYVIIGAGHDSFGLRRPDLVSQLTVFELDHPDTQRAKRNRLAGLERELPKQLEFVPVDFEVEAFDEALARSSFQREKRAFFSWLGTVPYLTEETVFSVLSALSSLAATGSQLVFDYAVPDALVDDSDRRAVARLRRFTTRRGEPLISFFEPVALCQRVSELGYRVLENLAPSEQNRRYFSDRSDGLRTLSGSYYLHASVVT